VDKGIRKEKTKKVTNRLVSRTVKGNLVEINVYTFPVEVESLEAFEDGTLDYENEDSFSDEVELFVKINNDSLKISCKWEEPSKKSGEDYIFRRKFVTTIKGENYGSSSDFFKKLSELNIVKVRTFDGTVDPGHGLHLLYFMLFPPPK